MSDVMKVLDEARYCLGLDNRDAIASQLLEAQLEIARLLAASPAHDGEVVAPSAWMRKWYADGIRNPKRKDGVRGWMLRSITENQLQDDDVPLYTAPPRVADFLSLVTKWEARAGEIGNYTQERTAASAAIRDCADQLQAALEKQ